MNMPILSIIIPVYNSEQFLSKCIDSVLSQEFADFELILINDGSQDSSLEICETYVKQDHRVVLHTKENGGQAIARNIALKLAKGIYIAFVDSDDYISEDFFSVNMAVLLADSSIDLIHIPYVTFSGNEIHKVFSNIEKEVAGKENVFRYLISSGGYLWNKIYKKELFDNVYFPSGQIMEDLNCLPTIIQNVGRLRVSNKGKYFYRENENSTVHRKHSPKILRDLMDAYLSVVDACYKNNYRDLFIKFYALYISGYYSAICLFPNENFKEFRSRYDAYNFTFAECFYPELSLLQIVKLLFVKIFGIHCFAQTFRVFYKLRH